MIPPISCHFIFDAFLALSLSHFSTAIINTVPELWGNKCWQMLLHFSTTIRHMDVKYRLTVGPHSDCTWQEIQRDSDMPGGCCLLAVRLSLIFSEGAKTLQVSRRMQWALCSRCPLTCLSRATQSFTIPSVMIHASVCNTVRKVCFQLLADARFVLICNTFWFVFCFVAAWNQNMCARSVSWSH